MNISLVQLVLALLPVLVPVCIIQMYGLRLLGKTMASFLVMTVKYAVLALGLYAVSIADSVWANVLCALGMMLLAAVVVTRRAHLPLKNYALPVLAGVAAAVAGLSLYVLFLVMGSNLQQAGIRLLPLVGVLCGSILEVSARSLTFYYMGLKHHAKLYCYLVGNGATPAEALFYFRKRALEHTLLHYLSRMALAVVAVTPVALWALLLCGVPLLTAVALQVALFVSSFAAAMLSVAVTLFVAGRYVPDGYTPLTEAAVSKTCGDEPASQPDSEDTPTAGTAPSSPLTGA